MIIQHESGHGCCLVIERATEVALSDIEAMIRGALDADWEPTQDGPNHWVRVFVIDGVLRLDTIERHDEVL